MEVEVIIYYDAPGREYVRDLFCEGIWAGIESRKFVSLEEAKKLGYKVCSQGEIGTPNADS